MPCRTGRRALRRGCNQWRKTSGHNSKPLGHARAPDSTKQWLNSSPRRISAARPVGCSNNERSDTTPSVPSENFSVIEKESASTVMMRSIVLPNLITHSYSSGFTRRGTLCARASPQARKRSPCLLRSHSRSSRFSRVEDVLSIFYRYESLQRHSIHHTERARAVDHGPHDTRELPSPER